MTPLKINIADFGLSSAWRVTTGSQGEIVFLYGPTEGSQTITFNYDLPADITVISSKVHAVWGSKYGPTTGYATGYPKVNDVKSSSSNNWMVDVSIDPEATSVDVTFKLKVNGILESPGESEKSNYVDVSDVYLLIEYEPNYTPPVLVDYTDSNLVQGETYVKAVHMTELHTNVNLVRVARKFAEHEFTSIVAMETSLAGWNGHVLEIRSAIDEMNLDHENWIKLAENYPRLDVLLQLRRVVQTVSGSDATSPTNPANPNMLGDGSTGATYELSVADGELTMTEVEAANPPSSSILMDTVTSKAYEFKVVDGDLTMSEIESGTPSQFGTFTDTVTSTTYKLSVVDGDLTMSEA